ncbi:GntR family transcriptional regulator [Streptomyces kronopolitis]|uniref:GntR family transcriptional regulator n=1 Tax=Streptomyces kronopolitis TaxID=1612435 RepID=UPI0020BE3353|nr:GntR family transcriptional regulator [Streptomyces kronopolitis]MCL6300281.1 GntR family transcriptional regulator [Streptomyces kronopolitis]
MSREIIRHNAIYMQVADQLAQAIKAGEYEPGSKLPSETDLMNTYGISRPTARSAVSELRNMGLVESRHGRGTFVRPQTAPASSLARTISRSGKRYAVPELEEKEQPGVTRIHILGTHAELLQRREDDAEDAFSADHLMIDPDSGARISHRVIIPMNVAAEAPALAETPDAPAAELYAHLTEAGHALSWQEFVTARTPLPDEREVLGLADASPILITYRITYGTDDQPLMCEELHTAASRARLVYRITPEKAPAKRPRQTKA